MSDGTNMIKSIAKLLRTIGGILGFSGMDPLSPPELDAERQTILHGPDRSSGLHPDFSDTAVRARFSNNSSGLSPHLRPGHAAPDEPDEPDGRVYGALHSVDALNGDDNLSHT